MRWICEHCGYETDRLIEVDQHEASCNDLTNVVAWVERKEGWKVHYTPTDTVDVREGLL